MSEGGAQPGRRRVHLWQVDLLRIVPMMGVVIVHVLIFSAPPDDKVANGLIFFFHINRELFFFITAFVLFYSTGAWEHGVPVLKMWRRRYPLIVLPYLVWTLIYWPLSEGIPPSPAGLGINLVTGWFHLYFLLVTMQFYLFFPLLAWALRRTRRWHWLLLLGSTALQVLWTAYMQYGYWDIPSWLHPLTDNAQVFCISYQFYFVAGGLAATYLDQIVAWTREHRGLVWLGVAAGFAVSMAWYGLNLLFEAPHNASGVFQPAVILLLAVVVSGLWMIADHWLATHPVDGRLWRLIHSSAEASFGIYLSHMVFLLALTQPPILDWFHTDELPWGLSFIVRFLIVVAGALTTVAICRRTPLSKALTGRPRIPFRSGPLAPAHEGAAWSPPAGHLRGSDR